MKSPIAGRIVMTARVREATGVEGIGQAEAIVDMSMGMVQIAKVTAEEVTEAAEAEKERGEGTRAMINEI
jgi:hypothetical protein